MTHGTLEALSEEVRQKRGTLLVGAGASMDFGIPGGYRLAIQFAEANRHILSPALADALDRALNDRGKEFAQKLVDAFRVDFALQETMTSWIERYPKMNGGQSDDHTIFTAGWLRRLFSHLVTTNWDFL